MNLQIIDNYLDELNTQLILSIHIINNMVHVDLTKYLLY